MKARANLNVLWSNKLGLIGWVGNRPTGAGAVTTIERVIQVAAKRGGIYAR